MKKRINVFYGVFAALFAIMLDISRHVFYEPSDRGTVENVYFQDMSFVDLIAVALFCVFIYTVITALPDIKNELLFGEKREGRCGLQFILTFITMAVCYFPYVASYWPGGIYSDTVGSMEIALGTEKMTSHEPIGYTLLWKLMFKVAGGSFEPGDYGAMYMFTVVQTLAMILLLTFFVNWLYRRGLKNKACVIITLIFSLYSLYPFYSVSLWKDTVFGMIIFGYSWFLFCLNESIKEKEDISRGYLIGYIIFTVCVIFFRNNGIYVAIITSIIATLTMLKIKKAFKKVVISSIAAIAVCFIIQHPVFDALGYNVDSKVESLSIPIQQTAYILCTDGKVSDENLEVINNIMPLELWYETYDPSVVDYIKFDSSFNRDWFNDHMGTFMKTYLELCLANPAKAVKGYLLATMGYWDIFKSSSSAYICPQSIAWTGIFQGDYFGYYTDINFQEFVMPRHYASAAVFAWMAIFVFFSLLANRRFKDVLPLIPALAVWFTIMLAAPLAFSFRYLFAVFLCVPICFLCFLKK